MQFLFNILKPKREPAPSYIQVGDKSVSLLLVLNNRSKRYVLRLNPDGTARVTIPRGGSQSRARQFAEKNVDWLKRQFGLLVQTALEGPQRMFRRHTGVEIDHGQEGC